MARESDSQLAELERERYKRLLEEAQNQGYLTLVGRLETTQTKSSRDDFRVFASLYRVVSFDDTAIAASVADCSGPRPSPVLAPEYRRRFIDLVDQLKQHQQELVDLQAQILAATGDSRETLEQKLLSKQGQDHPYLRVWNRPGWSTRQMIGLRVAIFGDWCVPSLCGTDALGRDILSRICWGARVSLMVGMVATLVSLVIGVSFGAISGYFGGVVDAIMMRIVDILYSIPFIFVVIFVITILSEESVKLALASYGIDRMVVFYIIIGLIYWLTMARVVRGQIMSLKQNQYIDAARVAGAGNLRIIFRHLVPNVMGIVIVYLTLTIPAVMLFEAFLSFLGMGVSPPDVSWGLLVNEGMQVITPIRIYWWLVLFPGLTLTLTLLALNFLGDGMRDALDPRMKNH